MKNQVWLVLFIGIFLNAQSINIGNFYYRDYLDFGQNKGGFASANATLTGKDGTTLKVPNVPNFQASSNYGSLTSVGRGFGVTANHVTNVIDAEGTRKFGLTDYKISDKTSTGISNSYGWDSKFIRLDKYVVEGEAGLLNVNNSLEINADKTTKENNLKALQTELENFKDKEGNIYLYQAGTGEVTLYNTKNQTNIAEPLSDGSMKGGGFGTLEALQYGKCGNCGNTNTQGMVFNYVPDDSFANIITKGDSGSGFYAYDVKNEKWVLLGVVSQTFVQLGGNEAKGSFVSQSDLEKFKEKFEKKIDLSASASWTMDYQGLTSTSNNFNGFKENADIIFSGNGTINIEVKSNIQRNNENKDNGNVLNSGGFVFEASNSATATNPTKYVFTNNGTNQTYFFKGSGLDIGENVELEWHLRNESGDALHKVGKGTLIVKTNYTPKDNENLGYLKLGEGKVILDTDKKAFEGIYITSGRASVELKQAEAIGATKNTTARSDTQALSKSYTLAQSTNTDMGFYFGTGGGLFDLSGNSLKLNTVAANDNKAIITNSSTSAVDFEIEGFGYTDGKKSEKKADTIIHASFGERGKAANLNLITQSDTKANDAHLIFDGDINITGSLQSTNSNIVLQGHPTAHATISDEKIIEKIKNAENGTQKPMPDYMDLTKPSSLKQPDWDSRTFEIKDGIKLTNSTLTIGKAANVIADIEADSTSQINFGGKHFIDEKDTKNITGSGFAFYQLIKSGDLNENESYKDSSYSGKITADGTQITSKFFNFAPNLDLKNKASLNATSLTISNDSDIKLNNSTLTTQNLTVKGMSNLNNDKIKLESNATFEVKESFIFDSSTFSLDSLNTATSLTLPTEYNLAGLNKSNITTNSDFSNSKENAQLFLDDSNFTAKNVNFTGANANVLLQNNATFEAEKLDFSQNANIILSNKAEMNVTSLDLKAQGGLFLDKESKLTLTSTLQGKDMNVSLNDKSTFTTTSDFTASDLTLFLQNESSFTAKKLTAQGKINISSDENSTLTLDTLELKDGIANINAKATIANLNLTNISEAFVGSNATLTNLNLTQSTANIANLADSAKVDLKDSSVLYLNGELSNQNFTLQNSTLHLNSLNLNDKFTLTGDDNSKTYLKKLSFDASNTANKNIQSNLIISESLTLKNVGQNLGNNSDEALKKDLLALEFGKELDLQGTKLDISFAEKLTKNDGESKLKFDEFYTIFSAQKLTHSNVSVVFNPEKFGNIFMQGKFEDNSYLIKFLKENPRNFDKLKENTNTQYWDLLEILLQHDKNDESIDKAIANTNDKTALNTRLAGLQKSFESLAATDEGVLKTLPLLQKQDINARIQQNRFTRAKFAFNDTLTRSDFLPTLLKFVEDERKNRAWSSAGASYFTHKDSKFTLQSVNLGYDRKLLNDELLLGVMAGLTQTQLNSNIMSLNPQIYTLALYSDMLFNSGQMQNELSFSLLNGDKSFENETSSYKSFHSFFESLYKFDFTKQIKPLVLARVNLSSVDDFSTPIYKQKGSDDISLDLGLGVEWLVEKENGFYSATFIAQRDIFHSQKEVAVSLANASKFINYKTNEPSFSYQLYLSGLENFSNGLFFRYSLSAYIDSKTYKGVKGDIGLGYRF